MKLHIEKTATTPEVDFNPETNIYSISGWSSPENAAKFYQPVMHWLNDFGSQCLKDTKVIFKINYFNTSTAKMLYRILEKLQSLSQGGCKIKIVWYCMDEEDREQFESTFGSLIKLPVEFETLKKEEWHNEQLEKFHSAIKDRLAQRGRDDIQAG